MADIRNWFKPKSGAPVPKSPKPAAKAPIQGKGAKKPGSATKKNAASKGASKKTGSGVEFTPKSKKGKATAAAIRESPCSPPISPDGKAKAKSKAKKEPEPKPKAKPEPKAKASTASDAIDLVDSDEDFQPVKTKKGKKARKVLSDSEEDGDATYNPEADAMDESDEDGSVEVVEVTKKRGAPAQASQPQKKMKAVDPAEFFGGKPASSCKKPAAKGSAQAVSPPTPPQSGQGKNPDVKEKESTQEESEPKEKKAKATAAQPPSGKNKRSYASFSGPRKEPPNKGAKEVPQGAPGCLEGSTFVISGVLDSLTREDATDIIKRYAGKVTTAVSGRTTFLLLGSVLDDGRDPTEGSKYQKAQKHGTKVISEDEFLKLLKDSQASSYTGGSTGGSTEAVKAEAPKAKSSKKPNPYAHLMKAKEAKGKGKGKKKAQEVTAASSAPGQLWADKYKPQAVADVLGNAANVKKLSSWLQDWDKNFLADKVKPDKSKPKSALLSGPPGIGKTSSATMVLKQLGYHMTELNASDTRSKKSVAAELTEVIQNTVLNVGGQKDQQQKRAIVMDEVDGMGGSDRGGIQELITLIKKSKVPIICICNDRGHTKVRSLANHCLDLRFNRPTKGTIAKRMQAIAEAEGLEVETNAIELLAESLGNDIRMILNALQMWSRTKKSMSYMEAKDGLKTLTKDKMLRVNTFDAAKMIFDLSKPLWDRTDAFFVDYNIMPLFVQQNYLNSLRMSDRDTQVDRMTQAADAVSDADLVAAMVRGTENHWELLTTQAAMNCRIANFTKGPIGNATFPEWFGKNSTTGKRKRLLAELSTHLMWRVSSNRETLRQTYIPALRERLLRPLIESQVQGVEETVDLLDEYGLSRDDLVDVLPEFVLQDGNPDHIKSLSTATKTALTKEYNSRPHTSAALVQAMSAPKKKRKAAVDVDEAAEGEEGAEEAEADEDEEEDVAALQKRFAKKKGRGKAKGKPAAKGKGKGRAKG